jgi:hypothetical protein
MQICNDRRHPSLQEKPLVSTSPGCTSALFNRRRKPRVLLGTNQPCTVLQVILSVAVTLKSWQNPRLIVRSWDLSTNKVGNVVLYLLKPNDLHRRLSSQYALLHQVLRRHGFREYRAEQNTELT